MRYILATHGNDVQWYHFDPKCIIPGNFELTTNLNLDDVPIAHNKETAKLWALALGLRTWRYVKI